MTQVTFSFTHENFTDELIMLYTSGRLDKLDPHEIDTYLNDVAESLFERCFTWRCINRIPFTYDVAKKANEDFFITFYFTTKADAALFKLIFIGNA